MPFVWCETPPRYDFEVHFESESHGTQTNLTTGKVRRIQRLQKGEAFPATWRGFTAQNCAERGTVHPPRRTGYVGMHAPFGGPVRGADGLGRL